MLVQISINVSMVSALKRVGTEWRSWVVSRRFSRNRSPGQTEVKLTFLNACLPFIGALLEFGPPAIERSNGGGLSSVLGAPFPPSKEPMNPCPEWNLLIFLIHDDPSDIGSLILILTFPNKRTL